MSRQGLVGKQLDEYRIVKLLGQGGMARVYLATDVHLKRKVAIKVIKAPLASDPDYIKRFEREAQAAARLEHPHIVRLYRYGEVNETLYMAMQYLEGPDLKTLLATYRTNGDFISLKDAVPILTDICSALDYAHHQGVIHRDIKPSNIILDKQGRAYLSDFGLARLSNVMTRGKVFGSAHYIAPEQAVSSASAVPQSDLYAVGVIFYEMLTGQPPFNSDTPSDIALKHLSDPPCPPRELRPKISREIEAVALKMLAKQPDQRYATGAAFINALKRAIRNSGSTSHNDQPTLISSASLAQRMREAVVTPLPPVPAAVLAQDSISVQSIPQIEIANKSGRARRLLTRMILALALIVTLGLTATFGLRGSSRQDSDHDGITNSQDNCPSIANPDQQDIDGNEIGDACQDTDQDGVSDISDKCPDSPGIVAANGCIPTGVIQANTNNVNLRSGPGENYDVVSNIHPWNVVEVLGRNEAGDWLRIRTNNIEAWVYYNLVKIDIAIQTLPVAAIPANDG